MEGGRPGPQRGFGAPPSGERTPRSPLVATAPRYPLFVRGGAGGTIGAGDGPPEGRHSAEAAADAWRSSRAHDAAPEEGSALLLDITAASILLRALDAREASSAAPASTPPPPVFAPRARRGAFALSPTAVLGAVGARMDAGARFDEGEPPPRRARAAPAAPPAYRAKEGRPARLPAAAPPAKRHSPTLAPTSTPRAGAAAAAAGGALSATLVLNAASTASVPVGAALAACLPNRGADLHMVSVAAATAELTFAASGGARGRRATAPSRPALSYPVSIVDASTGALYDALETVAAVGDRVHGTLAWGGRFAARLRPGDRLTLAPMGGDPESGVLVVTREAGGGRRGG